MLVLTAQHIPHLLQQQHHPQHSAKGVSTDAPLSAQQQTQQHRKQKKGQGRASKQAALAPDAADSFPANPSTSPPGRTGSSSKHTRRSRQQVRIAAAAAQAAYASSEHDSIADITERLSGHMSMRGVGWEDVEEEGPFFCPAPKPDGASRSRLPAAGDSDQPHGQSPSSSSGMRRAGSSSSSARAGASSGSSPGPRHPRMDKGFKRLLKRLLTGFMADSSQREIAFPTSLSAADR